MAVRGDQGGSRGKNNGGLQWSTGSMGPKFDVKGDQEGQGVSRGYRGVKGGVNGSKGVNGGLFSSTHSKRGE